MARKKNLIGAWTFLIGAIVAVIFGAIGIITPTIAWVLVIIGLIVGFLNIADEESQSFLLSGAVLIIAGAFGAEAVDTIPIFARMMNSLLLIFVPATIVVAIKNVFTLARN